ncbi:MAG TPA: sodium:calcium antiporter, partial [Pirellulales bacterium]|nr:sodium:calcium antiporter [Pirellulales bacterium]
MFWYFLLLVGGCVLLYWGAIWLVQGASEIALNLHISKAIIGLSLVAFGTSAPELIVNLIAAYQGKTGFALTNVSGSNLTNLLVGFGLCGIISGLLIHWRSFLYDLYALVI